MRKSKVWFRLRRPRELGSRLPMCLKQVHTTISFVDVIRVVLDLSTYAGQTGYIIKDLVGKSLCTCMVSKLLCFF